MPFPRTQAPLLPGLKPHYFPASSPTFSRPQVPFPRTQAPLLPGLKPDDGPETPSLTASGGPPKEALPEDWPEDRAGVWSINFDVLGP